MEKEGESVFTKSTVIISLLLAILSGAGLLLKWDNGLFIILTAGIIIIVLVFKDKFNQLNENSKEVEEIKKSLDIEKRFNKIEKDIAEQRGMLFSLGGRK